MYGHVLINKYMKTYRRNKGKVIYSLMSVLQIGETIVLFAKEVCMKFSTQLSEELKPHTGSSRLHTYITTLK